MWFWAKWKVWVKLLITLPLLLVLIGLLASIVLVAINPKATIEKSNCVKLCGSSETACISECVETAKEGKQYPQKLQNTFVQSCVNNGATSTVCSCVLKYLESKISFNEFVSMESDITPSSKTPQVVLDAESNCANIPTH